MKKLLIFIALIAAIILPVASSAQSNNVVPVRWKISVAMTGSDTGILTLRAIPSTGWHLYGTDLPEGGPKSTSIDLSQSEGVSFDGELTPSLKPVAVDDKLFDMKLSWWDKPVQFTVKFKMDKGSDSATIRARVTFMACNDVTCAAPLTINLDQSVKRAK